MRKIKIIVEQIGEELEGAETYAKYAAKLKDTDKDLAAVYRDLASAELSHVDKLHEQVVRAIATEKSKGTDVPAAMQAVWDWEHDKMVDRTARIKMILGK